MGFPSCALSERDLDRLEGLEYLTLSFPNYRHAPNAMFTMRVIYFRKSLSFLALLPSKIYTQFASETNFGFFLGSPAEKANDGSGDWSALHAISPVPGSVDGESGNLRLESA